MQAKREAPCARRKDVQPHEHVGGVSPREALRERFDNDAESVPCDERDKEERRMRG